MGIVLRFPHHARASAGSAGAWNPNTAGSGAALPALASSTEKKKNRSVGMRRRFFQLSTAGTVTPVITETGTVPPKASTMASTDLSIPPCSSRGVNLSIVHKMAVDCGPALGFTIRMPESLKSLGNRLAQTREALGVSAAELCKNIGCKPNRWSQYEGGKRKITLDVAERLCDEYGLSLDWIYRANRALLPDAIRVKLPRTAA